MFNKLQNVYVFHLKALQVFVFLRQCGSSIVPPSPVLLLLISVSLCYN